MPSIVFKKSQKFGPTTVPKMMLLAVFVPYSTVSSCLLSPFTNSNRDLKFNIFIFQFGAFFFAWGSLVLQVFEINALLHSMASSLFFH